MPYVNCGICDQKFYAKPRHLRIGWGKYCSIKCRTQSQFNGKVLRCNNCKKKIYRTPAEIKKSISGNFFCSRSCHCVWENKNNRIAENAYNWNGGQNVYRKIMERSDATKKCIKCGLTDYRILEVHHKDKNRKNNRLNNLVWLCCNCHKLEHVKSRQDMVAVAQW